MNPYLLINYPISVFTYNYANLKLHGEWPECEPVCSIFPDIKVEIIPLQTSGDILAKCNIKLWLNGELASFDLVGSKVFNFDSGGKELMWLINHVPQVDDYLAPRIATWAFDEFAAWQPETPDKSGLIAVLFNASRTNRIQFKPFSDLVGFSVGYGAYEDKLLFAWPNELVSNPPSIDLAHQIYKLWAKESSKQAGIVAARLRDKQYELKYVEEFTTRIEDIYKVFSEAGVI